MRSLAALLRLLCCYCSRDAFICSLLSKPSREGRPRGLLCLQDLFFHPERNATEITSANLAQDPRRSPPSPLCTHAVVAKSKSQILSPISLHPFWAAHCLPDLHACGVSRASQGPAPPSLPTRPQGFVSPEPGSRHRSMHRSWRWGIWARDVAVSALAALSC